MCENPSFQRLYDSTDDKSNCNDQEDDFDPEYKYDPSVVKSEIESDSSSWQENPVPVPRISKETNQATFKDSHEGRPKRLRKCSTKITFSDDEEDVKVTVGRKRGRKKSSTPMKARHRVTVSTRDDVPRGERKKRKLAGDMTEEELKTKRELWKEEARRRRQKLNAAKLTMGAEELAKLKNKSKEVSRLKRERKREGMTEEQRLAYLEREKVLQQKRRQRRKALATPEELEEIARKARESTKRYRGKMTDERKREISQRLKLDRLEKKVIMTSDEEGEEREERQTDNLTEKCLNVQRKKKIHVEGKARSTKLRRKVDKRKKIKPEADILQRENRVIVIRPRINCKKTSRRKKLSKVVENDADKVQKQIDLPPLEQFTLKKSASKKYTKNKQRKKAKKEEVQIDNTKLEFLAPDDMVINNEVIIGQCSPLHQPQITEECFPAPDHLPLPQITIATSADIPQQHPQQFHIIILPPNVNTLDNSISYQLDPSQFISGTVIHLAPPPVMVASTASNVPDPLTPVAPFSEPILPDPLEIEALHVVPEETIQIQIISDENLNLLPVEEPKINPESITESILPTTTPPKQRQRRRPRAHTNLPSYYKTGVPRGPKKKLLTSIVRNAICDQCGNAYSKDYINAHKRELHNPNFQDSKCVLCQQHFRKASEWYQHYRHTHLGLEGRTPVTSLSNVKIQSPNSKKKSALLLLEKKKNLTHDPVKRPYKCGFCENSYTSTVYLKLHEHYQHSDEGLNSDNFSECGICKKKFKRKSYLYRHLKEVHKSDKGIDGRRKGILCKICSGDTKDTSDSISFKNETELISHIKDNHTESCYKCYYCGIVKISKLSWRFHVTRCKKGDSKEQAELRRKWREDGEKDSVDRWKIPCEFCGTETILMGLSRHYEKVHRMKEEETGWDCEDCGESFKRREYYVVHMESFHDKLNEALEIVKKCNVGERRDEKGVLGEVHNAEGKYINAIREYHKKKRKDKVEKIVPKPTKRRKKGATALPKKIGRKGKIKKTNATAAIRRKVKNPQTATEIQAEEVNAKRPVRKSARVALKMIEDMQLEEEEDEKKFETDKQEAEVKEEVCSDEDCCRIYSNVKEEREEEDNTCDNDN